MRVLVAGRIGQIATELVARLPAAGHAVLALEPPELDITDAASIARAFAEFRPEAVINAAAYTAVDRAEDERELAFAVNATGPGLLGEALGEAGIREHLTRYLILRTSWVMGAQGGNFLKTMLRQAAERESLRVVADQFGVPTPARLLAQLGWLAWQHCVRMESSTDLTPPWGLYHVAPRGETTWYDYARFMLSEALIRGWCLKAGPSRITPVPAAAYPSLAQRPTNSRLDVSRFEQAFNLVLPPWQDGVRDTLDELRSVAA